LELQHSLFSIFQDKFVEQFNSPTNPESLLPGDPAAIIDVDCKPTIVTCFQSFSPVQLTLAGATMGGLPSLFVQSSKGGLLKLPDVDVNALTTVNFAGPEWEELTALSIGFYFPLACGEDPLTCPREVAFSVESLTFQPVGVPEPALVSLLGIAAGGLLHRRSRGHRARAY
jgi:hypothetical protein